MTFNCLLGPCTKNEFLTNPDFITSVDITPFVFVDHILPKSGGATFKKLPVEINIKVTPDSDADVKEVAFTNMKTNIAEFEVEVIGQNNKVIETVQVVKAKKADIKTTESIKAIKITITKTTDGKGPSNVELSVKGCKSTESTTKKITTITATTPESMFSSSGL